MGAVEKGFGALGKEDWPWVGGIEGWGERWGACCGGVRRRIA